MDASSGFANLPIKPGGLDMVSLKPTQIGVVLSLMVAGGAHAQTLAPAPATTLSTVTLKPALAAWSNDIAAGRKPGLMSGASASGYVFGGRAVSVSSLSLNRSLRRSDVASPDGLHFEAVQGAPYGAGARLWSNNGWSRAETENRAPTKLRLAASWSDAFGIDTKTSNLKLGAAIGYSGHQDDIGGGFNIDARGVSGSLNAAYTSAFGLYVQGAVGYAPRIKLNRIRRPGSFGPTSFGISRAKLAGGSLQTGYTTPLFAGWEGGPFVSVDYLSVEMGARVSRGGMPISPMNFGRSLYSYGAEAFGHWGKLTPSLQFAYVEVDAIGARTAPGALAGARHPFATSRRPIDIRYKDHAMAGAALDGMIQGFSWRAQLEGRLADRTDIRSGLALSKTF